MAQAPPDLTVEVMTRSTGVGHVNWEASTLRSSAATHGFPGGNFLLDQVVERGAQAVAVTVVGLSLDAPLARCVEKCCNVRQREVFERQSGKRLFSQILPRGTW